METEVSFQSVKGMPMVALRSEKPVFAVEPTVAADTVLSHLRALEDFLVSVNRESEYFSVQRMVEGLMESFAGQCRVSAEPVGRNLDLISDWLGEDALGLRLGPFSSRQHPRLEFFFKQSHLTLFDYCCMLKRYLTITTDVFSVGVERSAGELTLTFHPHPDVYVSRHQIEGVVSSVCDAVLDCYGLTPSSIRFTTPDAIAPEDYQCVLGCCPEFDQSFTQVTFNCANEICDFEASPSLSAQAFRDIQALEVAHRQQVNEESWTQRCRLLLELLLSYGEPTKILLAELLAVTPRTLQRRLADEGTSCRELLADVRLTKAKEYLLANELSLDDIAFLLGFKDTAVFYRAFKQWTRMTPGEFRAMRSEHYR